MTSLSLEMKTSGYVIPSLCLNGRKKGVGEEGKEKEEGTLGYVRVTIKFPNGNTHEIITVRGRKLFSLTVSPHSERRYLAALLMMAASLRRP